VPEIARTIRSRIGERLRRIAFERRSELLGLLPRGSVGCEIGVWKGDFSAQILKTVKPRELHLVDPWRFASEAGYDEAWYGGALARSQEDMDRIYEGVKKRFRVPIEEGVVVIHRFESAAVAPTFADDYFDWIYIDGNHLYEYVRADLESFTPKVRSGGLVTGDDYGDPGWWKDGVRRAVDEFVASGAVEAISLSNQFILRRR
jgi:hypothetical protein